MATRKRPTACERCNRRRVKCDASVRGLPCSECQRSSTECHLMPSKRKRAFDTRHTLPKQTSHRSSEPATNTVPEGPSDALHVNVPGISSKNRQSDRELEESLNLAGLVVPSNLSRAECSDPNANASQGSLSGRISKNIDSDQANAISGSWYASYVVSNGAADLAEIHEEAGRQLQKDQSTAQQAPPCNLPPQHVIDQLVGSFFKHFHVFCPILDRASFQSAVKNGSVSLTLLRCVLFVAVIHCESEMLRLTDYTTRLDAIDDLFAKARATFDADKEADRTTLILSSFLLHYWFGQPTSYQDSLWWLANSIRWAQGMGYNRSTKHSKLSTAERSRRRLVWWCLYVRDRQVSISTGTSMIINDLDFDVEGLTMEDFGQETPETARYMISQATLCQTASTIYFAHCAPKRLCASHDVKGRMKARLLVQNAFEKWYSETLNPHHESDHHHLTLTIKVCYYYYVLNFQQQLLRPRGHLQKDPDGARVIQESADMIFSLVEDSLLYWTPERFPMIYVGAIFSAMTAQVAKYGASKQDRLKQKLRPSLLALKQLEQCYITARWIRFLFMDFLCEANRRVNHVEEEATQQPDTRDRGLGEPPTIAQHQVGETSSFSDNNVREGVTSSPDTPRTMEHMLLGDLLSSGPRNDSLLYTSGLEESHPVDFFSVSAMDMQSMQFLANVETANFAWFPTSQEQR